MKVKRFFAADMRQAMKLVREELGPDASIIANRRVVGGVELTAANGQVSVKGPKGTPRSSKWTPKGSHWEPQGCPKGAK